MCYGLPVGTFLLSVVQLTIYCVYRLSLIVQLLVLGCKHFRLDE
jgi:hypothetical protein